MIPPIPNSWSTQLADQVAQPYFTKLNNFLAEEQLSQTIYPPSEKIFTALRLTPYSKVKVLLLGQDPYVLKGQAHGLCFSIEDKKFKPLPPSLLNVYRELESDIGLTAPNHGNLSAWARQGVLMLNAVLTVREKMPNSHKEKGWEVFTNAIIRKVNEKQSRVVFMFMGKLCSEKGKLDRHQPSHNSQGSASFTQIKRLSGQ